MKEKKRKHIKNMIDEQNALKKFHSKKLEKPLFVRVKGKCGVVIIPIEYYLMGLDFENYGIAARFIEEDSKEMGSIIWDKDDYLRELKKEVKE